MAIDPKAKTLASIQFKTADDAKKMIRGLTEENKKYRKDLEETLKASGKWTDNMIENNKELYKLSDSLKKANQAEGKFFSGAQRNARKLGEDYENVHQAADQFSRLQFRDLRNNLMSIVNEVDGIGGAFRQLDSLTGFTKKKQAVAEMKSQMQDLQHIVDNPDLYSEEDVKYAGAIQDTLASNLETLEESAGVAAVALTVVLKGLTDVLNLQGQLQKAVAYSNVGYAATLQYISQIQMAVAATNGLIDVEGATASFVSLQGQFREFTQGGSHVVKTSAQLTAAIGYNADAFADLAATFRTVGVRDVDAGLKSAANTMAYFAKNTNLNTNEIQEMMTASKPLMEIYPNQLEKRLVPQLLSVAAAYKEIGLSGSIAAQHLEQMADLSNPQGLLKAAFAAQRGNISIDDILGGTKPGVAMAELGDSIHGLMENFSGGDRRKFEFAAQRVSEIMGISVSEARRFGNMNDEMRAKFRKRIEQEEDYAKQSTALEDALSEQMEGPVNEFKSLWSQVKITLLSVGGVAASVLGPVFNLIGKVIGGISNVFKIVGPIFSLIGAGIREFMKPLNSLVDMLGLSAGATDTLDEISSTIMEVADNMGYGMKIVQAYIADAIGYVVDGASFIAKAFDLRNFFANMYNSIPKWARKLLGGSTEDMKLTDTLGLGETAKSFHEAADSMKKTADEEFDAKHKDNVVDNKSLLGAKSGESSFDQYLRTGNLGKFQAVEGTDAEVHTMRNVSKQVNVGYAPRPEPTSSYSSPYDEATSVDNPTYSTAAATAQVPIVTQVKVPPTPVAQQEKHTEQTPTAQNKESSDQRRQRQQEMDSRQERDRYMRRLEESSMGKLLPPPFQEIVSYNNFS